MTLDSPMTSMKVCRSCGRSRPLDRFARDTKCRDGLSKKCKDCMKAYSCERYQRLRLQSGATYRRTIQTEEWLAIEARGTMTCRVCHAEKPLEEFRISYRAPRRRRICRDCERRRAATLRLVKQEERRAYHHRFRCRQYGITPNDYSRMLDAQEGKCAICGHPLGERHQTIDHCHRTGKVRGIVHSMCNLVLGNARERVEVLQGAIAYLAVHEGPHNDTSPGNRTEEGERP